MKGVFIWQKQKPPPRQPCPAVSVIIPLYNAEKYIGECLDSVLKQTFKDFEIIIVDDCSTDNSVEVVRNFAKKFGERLKLKHTKKNSGTPGEPTNLGIDFSRGEYLFFMDNDDAIAPNALEKLYTTAKNFNADVVACEKYMDIQQEIWYDAEKRRQLVPYGYTGLSIDKPTLIPEDITRRVEEYVNRRFIWPLWTKIIRRDVLIENKLRLEQTFMSDLILTSCLVFAAKTWVRVPYVLNYRRLRKDSLSLKGLDLNEHLHMHIQQSLIKGFNSLNNFLDEIKFFAEYPNFKLAVLESHINHVMRMYFSNVYAQIPAHSFEKILVKEFSESNNSALTAFIFSKMNVQNLQLLQAQQHIKNLELEIARLKGASK